MAKYFRDSFSPIVNPRVLRSKGIVVILGWTASRAKTMKKYANIYSELGVPCICAAPSMPQVWFASYGSAKAKKMLKGVEENSEEGSGVVLHLFSGSSTTFLPTFIKDLTNKDSKHHLSGIIFDSAPASYSARSGIAAARIIKQQGIDVNPLVYYASYAAGVTVTAIVGKTRRKSLRDVLDHPAMLQVPQLYLYSSSDSVIPMEYIEDEMRLQVSRGADVSSNCWHDSEHVRHFLKYPEEYTSQINKFMHKSGLLV